MLAIFKREVTNYLKRPLFWLGIAAVILGVYLHLDFYLQIHFLFPGEQIVNNYPETIHAGETWEGYIPTPPEERRSLWEASLEETFVSVFGMSSAEAKAAIKEAENLSIYDAVSYFEENYPVYRLASAYERTKYRKGTNEEINAYLGQVLSEKPFSYYFLRKFMVNLDYLFRSSYMSV